MNKDHFAKSFGFISYEEMVNSSMTVFQENDIAWCVTKLPQGKYLAWDDAEIADDRVEIFFSKEEAENYLDLLRRKSYKPENLKH